jgi:formylglycine-generating enzyme required for sulfatase activity
MTQYAAKQYTKWLSRLTGNFYRLPAEVEWEYACRAGSNTLFAFGDDPQALSEYGWYAANSSQDTHPVGLKKPNRWGLYDMHGNAREWVLDQYSPTYAPLRKLVAAGEQPIQWPTQLHPRTVRGGSWNSDAADCRSAARVGSSVEWQREEAQFPHSPHWLASGFQREVGFRIARPLNRPTADVATKYWDADVKELQDAVAEYCSNGHSSAGIVDANLPAAVEELERSDKKRR